MIILIVITETGIRIAVMPDLGTCFAVAMRVAHLGVVACGSARVGV